MEVGDKNIPILVKKSHDFVRLVLLLSHFVSVEKNLPPLHLARSECSNVDISYCAL